MDETPHLDRIHTKAVPRKVIFEIFDKMQFWRFFEVSDFEVVFRKNNVDHMCAPRSGLELTLSGQCFCALVQGVSQPLYPFGHTGIMYTSNDITNLLNPFWQYLNVKVNVLHIELSTKKKIVVVLVRVGIFDQ